MLHAAAEREALGRAGSRVNDVHLMIATGGRDGHGDTATISAKTGIVKMVQIRDLDSQSSRRRVAPRDMQCGLEVSRKRYYFSAPSNAEIHCRSRTAGRESRQHGHDIAQWLGGPGVVPLGRHRAISGPQKQKSLRLFGRAARSDPGNLSGLWRQGGNDGPRFGSDGEQDHVRPEDARGLTMLSFATG